MMFSTQLALSMSLVLRNAFDYRQLTDPAITYVSFIAF